VKTGVILQLKEVDGFLNLNEKDAVENSLLFGTLK
jgi:hypothetical protein